MVYILFLKKAENMIKKAQVYRRKGTPNAYQVFAVQHICLLGGFTVVS